MKKILALIIARNKEFYRDHTAMIWSLIFPMVVLLGFNYGYSGKQEPILTVTVVPESALATSILKSLRETPGVKIQGAEDQTQAIKKLQRYETDFVISLEGFPQKPGGYFLNPDSEKGKLAEYLLNTLASKQRGERISFESRMIEGTRIRYSDWVLPGLLAMNIMFGSMFGVGYVIVRYRKNGVLKRLRATPLSAFQFLTAQVISRMLLMVVTSYLVLVGAMCFIGFKPQGSLLDVGLFLMISSAAMISVGLVVAARISNEEVADGVLNLMTWPMIFLSGIWFSLDGANRWVIFTSKLLPLTHIVDGLRAILIDGTSLIQLLPQIGLLCIITTVLIALGSTIFKWR